jgi:glycosyltransferase involved in cell wall biosynthesis
MSVKSLSQPFINRLIDRRNQTLFLRLCRWGLKLGHPHLHFLYLYRSGNLLAAEKIAHKSCSDRTKRSKAYQQLKEMVAVLENGRQPIKPTPYNGKHFNGRVIFALHSSLPWHRAGYAIRTQHILKHLKLGGLEITAVTRPGFPWVLEAHGDRASYSPEDEIDGISYQRLSDEKLELKDGENSYIQGYAKLLAHLAKKNESRIIHASSNYLNGLAGAMAARLIGGLAVYEMRGLWHMSRSVMEAGYENSDHYRYCEIMELVAAHESHAVVVLSQSFKHYLIERGIDAEKIHVIPNAVDIDYFSPVQRDEKLVSELGLQGRMVIGFLGSLTGYEGIDLLIQAVSKLIREGYPLDMVIAGTGYAEKSLRKEAGRTAAGKHIHFVGHVPFEQIKSYYSVSDILPFPRKDIPACRLVPPLKILEAMAMEKAIIVSNLPPLTEIIRHEKTGHVCRANDANDLAMAVESLVNRPEHQRDMGKAAREWVRAERSWAEVAKKFVAVYGVTS